MIAVFVGDEDRVDLVRTDIAFFKHVADPLAAEADIDQRFAVLGDEQATVARAATAENRELHRHLEQCCVIVSQSNGKVRISAFSLRANVFDILLRISRGNGFLIRIRYGSKVPLLLWLFEFR